jgi:ABC-type multidrug transport system fused ATPase/permease subunit
MAIDRGNYVVLSTPAVALALYFIFYRETNYLNLSIIAFLLVFALLLKTYVLMIIIILFLLKFFKIVITTLFIFFFGNLIISLFYDSGPIQIVKVYLWGILFYSDNSDPIFPLSGNGIFAGLAKSLKYFFNTDPYVFTLSYGKYSTLIGILWFILCLVIILSKYSTKDIKIIYMLSNLQFFAPVSMFYTNIWNVFALAFCLIELNKNQYSTKFKQDLFLFLIRILIIFVTILSISVNPFDWYRIVSPLAWIFLSFIVLIYLGYTSFQTKRLNHVQSTKKNTLI